MSQPTLVVMAAGIGRRYGGLKQIDPIGPNGEIIVDYSIYDALNAGFGKVVFVIKEDIEEAFREDELNKRLVIMLVDLGRYEQAIQMLTEDRFVPSEMDQSFRLAYVGAYPKRAQAHIEGGRIEEAITDYRRALEFPENVGVGRPVSTANAEILYRLGCACEQLGRFGEAVAAWQEAVGEHHPHGSELFPFVQMSLDKLNRYSELGFR